MPHSARHLARSAVLAVLFPVFGCYGTGGTPSEPPAGPNQVFVEDNLFNPESITITAGDTVTWTWKGSNPHTVTFDAGPPDSPRQASGTFQRTFPTAGTFTYICTVHGRDVMSGTVIVE